MTMMERFQKRFGISPRDYKRMVAEVRKLKAKGTVDPDAVAAALKAKFPSVKHQAFPVIFAPMPPIL